MAFVQRIQVPAFQGRGGGDLKLRGTFDLGEGAYHVDWQMQDLAERTCSSSWDVEAALTSKEQQDRSCLASGHNQAHARRPILTGAICPARAERVHAKSEGAGQL